MSLRIAHGLELPVDVVTQPIAILARRGAGKTYTASVVVEEVVRAKVPVVVLDPTGAWWGLRSSVDGEKPGLPVVIFGGDHGDVGLEPSDGKTIADVVIEHPGAYVVDLSSFESKAAEVRFAGDFLERLYRAKKRETGPLLLVVDEADVFAPQRPIPGSDSLRTLGATEAIVRRGRIKGLGDLLISQRAAVLNKNVLTQTEVLIVMQTTGPQDRAAIDDWIAGNGTREECDEVLGSLASLERGEAWVWSPSFLRVLQRVRIRPRTTFDSSRTPEAGSVAISPRAFAAVDLERLGARITAAREQQKANDPVELRRRIAILEREAKTRDRAAPPPPERVVETVEKIVEVPVLNGQVERLEAIAVTLRDVGQAIASTGTDIIAAISRVNQTPQREQGERAPRGMPVRPAGDRGQTAVATLAPAASRRDPAPASSDGTPLRKAERLILAALAQYPEGRTQIQVAILTGYAVTGGGFNNAIGALRGRGLIAGTKERLVITDDGLGVLGDNWTPLPTGRALLDYWLPQLKKAERLIVEALAAAYPEAMTKEALGEATGYEPSGGGFNNALSRLRTLELVERGIEPRLSDYLA